MSLDHDTPPPTATIFESITSSTDPLFLRVIDKLSNLGMGVSMFLLYPGILIIIAADVIGRNFFHAPVSWAIEGSGVLLVGCIFLTAGRVELEKKHILLDVFYTDYSEIKKAICDMFTRFLAFLWTTVTSVRCYMEVQLSFRLGETGGDFKWQYWPARLAMAIGFTILTLCLMCTIYDAFKRYRKATGGQK
jgi:TRAP-type C4-dicarboxylate transport system permease small subunit